MATVTYTGGAIAVAQVDTFTPGGTIEADDIFILTVTLLDGRTKAISTAAGGTTVADVTAALLVAWNADSSVFTTNITGADNTTTFSLTSDVAGTAFSVAQTTTEANGDAADAQTFGRTATTANAGPANWNDTGNWSGGALPGDSANDDTVVSGATILYGLDQSGIGNTLDSLTINRSQIGTNPADGFNPTYLQIKSTIIDIGKHNGPGTSAEKAPVLVDTGSTASTINIHNSTTNSITTLPAVRLKANSASTNINVFKGRVGIASGAGESSTIGVLSVSHISQVATDSDVTVGNNVTITGISIDGGISRLESLAVLVNVFNGSVTTEGVDVAASVNIYSGTYTSNSTGTITTLQVFGGTADFSRSTKARTVTTVKVDPGGVFKYDIAALTLTNNVRSILTAGSITLTAS